MGKALSTNEVSWDRAELIPVNIFNKRKDIKKLQNAKGEIVFFVKDSSTALQSCPNTKNGTHTSKNSFWFVWS